MCFLECIYSISVSAPDLSNCWHVGGVWCTRLIQHSHEGIAAHFTYTEVLHHTSHEGIVPHFTRRYCTTVQTKVLHHISHESNLQVYASFTDVNGEVYEPPQAVDKVLTNSRKITTHQSAPNMEQQDLVASHSRQLELYGCKTKKYTQKRTRTQNG